MRFKRSLQSIGLLFIICSCSSGYQKEDGKWAWINYNEGAGREVKFIDVADSETFKVLKNKNYALDKNHVYMRSHIIEYADSKTFTLIDNGDYSKDTKHVFFKSYIVIKANPITFEVLEWPYSKDDKHIFCGNVPLNLDTIEGFKVLETRSGTGYLSKSSFIKFNPDYGWLDTVKETRIIEGYGIGETEFYIFEGYKKSRK